MQKPIGGLSVLAENVEDRSPIACSANQKHVENYLKRGYRLPRAQQLKLQILSKIMLIYPKKAADSRLPTQHMIIPVGICC